MLLLATNDDDNNDDHDDAHFYLLATVYACVRHIYLKISLLCHHLMCPLKSCIQNFNKLQICSRKKDIFGLIYKEDYVILTLTLNKKMMRILNMPKF